MRKYDIFAKVPLDKVSHDLSIIAASLAKDAEIAMNDVNRYGKNVVDFLYQKKQGDTFDKCEKLIDVVYDKISHMFNVYRDYATYENMLQHSLNSSVNNEFDLKELGSLRDNFMHIQKNYLLESKSLDKVLRSIHEGKCWEVLSDSTHARSKAESVYKEVIQFYDVVMEDEKEGFVATLQAIIDYINKIIVTVNLDNKKFRK